MAKAKIPKEPLAKRARNTTGLTQEEFAEIYRIDVGTLRGWEQGRREPDRQCQLLLRMIIHSPKVVEALIYETENNSAAQI